MEWLSNHSNESLYLKWLYEKVSITQRDYLRLIETLHRQSFVWFDLNEESRREDAILLREDFASEMGGDPERLPPVSVLEILIILAKHLSDMTSGEEYEQTEAQSFWEMIDNMGLSDFDDEYLDYIFDDGSLGEIEGIIHNFLHRHYGRDGRGGPFYVENRKINMKKHNLWYQLNIYVTEKYY